MGNNSSKTQEYYNFLQNNPNQYDTIDITDMNPYEVFDLNDNFTWDELKNSYRRVARLVHPDKGGSEVLFKKITECFKHLAKEYKRKQSDKPHWELKKESQQYFDDNKESAAPQITTESNFIDRFNKAFDENRLEDEERDTGYGHIMEKSSGKRDDIEIPKLIKGKYNTEVFNKTFDTITLPKNKEVIIYKEPEALPMSKQLQYTEIGGEKPGDYTNTSRDTKLHYTDYMKAYTDTRLVDPRSVNKKSYKSIKEYETARKEAIERAPTDEELKWTKEKEIIEKRKEEERIRRAKIQDKRIAEHHARVNKLFIQN